MSSSEIPDDEKMSNKENQSLSTAKMFSYKAKKPSRRHTLLPSRGILKSTIEENNTIDILPRSGLNKRRVSFATAVDVRKIPRPSEKQRSSDSSFERRDSLQIIPSFQQSDNRRGFADETPLLIPTINKRKSVAISHLQIDAKNGQNDDEEEDDETDFSMPFKRVKLTIEAEDLPSAVEPSRAAPSRDLDLESVFNRVTQLPENEVDDNSTMELTGPFTKPVIQQTEDFHSEATVENALPKESEDNQSITMEFTHVGKHLSNIQEAEEYDEATEYSRTMDLTQVGKGSAQIINPEPERAGDNMEPFLPVDRSQFDTSYARHDQSQVEMDFTVPVNKIEISNFSTEHQDRRSLHANDDPIDDDEEGESVMEFTQPVTPIAENLQPIGTVTPERTPNEKLPSPSSSATKRIRTDIRGSPQKASNENQNFSISPTADKATPASENKALASSFFKDSIPELSSPPQALHQSIAQGTSLQSTSISNQKLFEENQPDHDHAANNHDIDSSYVDESVIVSEKIPLADVTMDSIGSGEESYSDDDYDYSQLPVSEFLEQVHVQFYDNIGPFEREFILPSGSIPTVVEKTADFLKYVEANTQRPYFSYLSHLINQYKGSLHDRRSCIEAHEKMILDGNQSIREYLDSDDSMKPKLKNGYQTLATFARQKATQENLKFLNTNISQLKSEYERDHEVLEADINETTEIKIHLLKAREKLLAEKLDLKKRIAVLKHHCKAFDVADQSKLDVLTDKLNSYNATRTKLLNVREATMEHSDSHSAMLISKITQKSKLLEHIATLDSDIARHKVPTTNDIIQLKNEFAELQKMKGLKLVSLTDKKLEVLVMNVIRLSLDMETLERKAEFIQNERCPDHHILSCLAGIFERRLTALKIPSLREYVTRLTIEASNYLDILKDLKRLMLYYQFNDPVNSHVSFVASKSNQYKMTISFDLEDLFTYDCNVSVDAKLISFVDSGESKADILHKIKETRSDRVLLIKRLFIG
ncbi:hypothetical protein CANARDRAFT_27160 [[Candida] arabinofermentans NRRL YB-2248]|uniref:Spc7 kinetochore protein domain-containing protein n=1 Tax=[Candida] arabinofermentans NRRL YB-2248 TaxID=983967 RepID=A0A1E4T4T2_9ASCO|nr:hypothetical protein CANARDRAFT_27160 [[Candida] arabinofermentans NRRL YB-2248]